MGGRGFRLFFIVRTPGAQAHYRGNLLHKHIPPCVQSVVHRMFLENHGPVGPTRPATTKK